MWDSNPHDPKVARFSKPARQAVFGYLPLFSFLLLCATFPLILPDGFRIAFLQTNELNLTHVDCLGRTRGRLGVDERQADRLDFERPASACRAETYADRFVHSTRQWFTPQERWKFDNLVEHGDEVLDLQVFVSDQGGE